MSGIYQLQWWQTESGVWHVRMFGEDRHPLAGDTSMGEPLGYEWRWAANLPDRKGHRLSVLARGTMNSALVQFADGARFIVSRNAIRKARAA